MTTVKILTEINDYIKTNDICVLLKLKENLEEQLREESIDKPLKNKDKLIKNVLKNVPKHLENSLGSVIKLDNNKFAFCDSFRCYLTANDFGYKPLLNPLDVKGVLPKSLPKYEIQVDMDDLQYHITHNKAIKKKEFLYVINCEKGNFKIGFNPLYLQEALKMYDTNVLNVGNPVSLAVMGDYDNGLYGILLPVRI